MRTGNGRDLYLKHPREILEWYDSEKIYGAFSQEESIIVMHSKKALLDNLDAYVFTRLQKDREGNITGTKWEKNNMYGFKDAFIPLNGPISID